VHGVVGRGGEVAGLAAELVVLIESETSLTAVGLADRTPDGSEMSRVPRNCCSSGIPAPRRFRRILCGISMHVGWPQISRS